LVALKSVLDLHEALRDDIGDLVTRRPLPGPRVAQIDPFLFLNHHGPQVYPPGNSGLPFGPHPHRGFETVTFILAGSLAHLDSGGHASVIDAGGVQWMTAGAGLVHAELSPDSFKAQGGPLEILQLWVNLPARLKMTEPRYVGLQRDDLPVVAREGARLQLIAGAFDGVSGPVRTLADVFMSVLELAPGGRLRIEGLAGRNVFLYVARGDAEACGRAAGQFRLVEFDEAGDAIELGSAGGATLLFGHAAPLREPVVAQGPFVMNTHEEIRAAFMDYRMGRFAGLRG